MQKTKKIQYKKHKFPKKCPRCNEETYWIKDEPETNNIFKIRQKCDSCGLEYHLIYKFFKWIPINKKEYLL